MVFYILTTLGWAYTEANDYDEAVERFARTNFEFSNGNIRHAWLNLSDSLSLDAAEGPYPVFLVLKNDVVLEVKLNVVS